MSSAQERGLALRAAQGDQQAFAEIVGTHQQAVFNVAYRMLEADIYLARKGNASQD